MNSLSWLLALSLLIILMGQAVTFHRATVCRQEAWLKSTELKTRSLLGPTKLQDSALHAKCRLLIKRRNQEITWQKLPGLKEKKFQLELNGHL